MHEDQNTALDQLVMTVQSTQVVIDTLLTHSVYFFLKTKQNKTHCNTENVCTHLPASSYLLIYDCENT